MVKTSSKLTYGSIVADWQDRLNVDRMRKERAARAIQIMKNRGVPAILTARNENIRYLVGLRGAGFAPQLRYVLFFAEHEPVVFEHAGYYQQMPEESSWIKSWRIARAWLGGVCGFDAAREEAQVFASEIQQEIRDRGLAGEKIVLEGFDGFAREALIKAGVNVVDDWFLMRDARAIKTQDEISCLKMTAAIAEVAWYQVRENLKPGMLDTELPLIVANAAYRAGAEDVPSVGWRTGPSTFERGHHQTGRIIQTGDLVYGSLCGIRYMGYGSCTYRTFIVGRKPNQKEKDWYKKLLDRMNAIIDAVKPGATTADAAKHFPPASSWGYKSEAEVLTIEIGHGIGLGGGYDFPIINRQWSLKYPQVFQPGMTFAVESCEGEHGVGGVRLEDMIVVTEKGAEIMDHMPREEIIVVGEW